MTILKPIVCSTSKRLINSSISSQAKFRNDKKRMYEKLTLSSYLSVCVDVGQVDRALKTLVRHTGPRHNPLVDVSHYNVVLRGWAQTKSLQQIVETRMHMIKTEVQPNAESYAYILLAYSYKYRHATNLVKRLINDMRNQGISTKTLFSSTYLSPAERSSIKTLLLDHDPRYEEVFCDVPISYNCKLLRDFDKVEAVPYDISEIKSPNLLRAWCDHQRSVESKSSVSIKSIINDQDSSGINSLHAKAWQKHIDLWRRTLGDILDARLEELKLQSMDDYKVHLYPYLCSVDKKLLLDILVDEVDTNAAFSNYSYSTTNLHLQLGNKIMTRYLKAKAIADGSDEEKREIYLDYLTEYCINENSTSQINPREYLQIRAAKTKNYGVYKDRINPIDQWPHHVVGAVGRFLYGIILKEVKFDPEVVKNPRREIKESNLVNAFYTAYFQMNSSHKIKEEFRAHNDLEKFHQKASFNKLKFDYSYLPTCTPPLPWLSPGFGGYLTNRAELIRTAHPYAERAFVAWHNIDNQKLYPSLDSLNAIGLCPWKVNQRILDAAAQVFRSGGDTNLNIPLDESQMRSTIPKLKDNPTKSDRILYNKERKKADQKRREMYSLWRDCLYRLSIANHFRTRIFWFPHNMDFRGRTYPIPPHFNHLGSDLARSLLLFAKGRPLGERGLDWLKVHCINLVGSMKANSLSERLDYVNSILQTEILDSADNPWTGNKWWQRNENPWQVLACCIEIAKAIRSGDPRKYICHFPVHQDGSCNGLQHYAALGRDIGGGMAVNLIPSDKPQDVYSRIVDIVERMRKQDAAKGVKMAIMLDGFIQRKVIKQTVMTTVYGVTRYGARQQIARQLIAKGYSEREVWQAANYLTGKTFDSIGQMFNKSRLIQDWLTDCAYTIASKYNQAVCWETPLGFPVKQPYTVPSLTNSSRLLSSSISTEKQVSNDPLAKLNAPKQKTAFPPNYIHSLDSSHMMLTSLHCQRKGITFVSVHDCYWTHPSTVDAMNEICRQQFVALHSEPLLKDLSDQFLAKYDYDIAGPKLKQLNKVVKIEQRNQQVSSNNSNNIKLSPKQKQLQLQQKLANQLELNKNIKPPVDPLLGVPQDDINDLSSFLANESRILSTEELNLHDDDDGHDIRGFVSDSPMDPPARSTVNTLLTDLEAAKVQARLRDRDTFKRVPKTGELNLEEVLKSVYFFS